MLKRFIEFIKNEDGDTTEFLVRVIIIGLGSSTVFFSILAAIRVLGGKVSAGIGNINF